MLIQGTLSSRKVNPRWGGHVFHIFFACSVATVVGSSLKRTLPILAIVALAILTNIPAVGTNVSDHKQTE
jgi:hypothetical protein